MLDAAVRRSRPSSGPPVDGCVNEDGNMIHRNDASGNLITSRGQSRRQTVACLATIHIYWTVCGIKVVTSREPEVASACAGTDPSMEVEVLWHGFS